MKHRHTFFIHDADPSLSEAFDLVPEKKDKPSELRIRHLPAAREWKVTIDLEDLDPKKATELRKGALTVQFVKDTAKDVPEPLQRGFVQGFHLFWSGSSDMANLPFLGSILPSSLPEPISLPDGLLYLHIDKLPTETTDSLFNTLWSFLSPESDPLLLASLANADVIEFDIPSPSTIQIRAIWAGSPHIKGWHLDIPAQSNARIEVGIFGEGHGQDKDECALGGLRAILGQDKDFEPTLFTFPHRHHVLQSKLETLLSPSYGSHPTLQTVLSDSALQAPMNDTFDHDTCSLHAMYTLSNHVFVDKYQLAQLAQFGSGGIQEIRGVWGETNLEDPSYHTPGWGSVVLVDIPDDLETTLTLELPLHLRYLEPVDGGGKRHVDILPPEIFWACENTVEDFSLSPFGPSSRSLLDTFFPGHTVFYHLPNHSTDNSHPHDSAHGVVSLQVPVADASKALLVQNLTVLGVLVGFSYLFIKGVRVGIKGLRWRVKGKEKAKDL